MTDPASTYLLDASAVLALLHREPGADAVSAILVGSAISAVNWSEVLQKAGARGIDVADLDRDFTSIGVTVLDFGQAEARSAAQIWLSGHPSLSLADRACLGTAVAHQLPVVTSDRSWRELDIGIPITVIR